MNGRQIPFGIPGHPLAQFLAMIVMAVVLVGAVVMGAFVLMGLLGLFAVGFVVFWIRAWWQRRHWGGRGPTDRGPGSPPDGGIGYIEGEYEVVDADTDAARRRPDSRK